jgi:hypothetical protein
MDGMAALAAAAAETSSSFGGERSGFTSIATTCECCGAPTALYYFNPFRAFCVEHGSSPPVLRPAPAQLARA